MPKNHAYPVIHDHDGHIDDLISLAMLATAKEVKLEATTLAPADCYLEPSTKAIDKLLTLFDATHVQFARSEDEGIHPFPHEFRKDSDHLPDLELFSNLKPKSCLSKTPAAELLVELLSDKQKYNIVETGPLTNIAAAIELEPTITKNITGLWVMGGAVHVTGNVRNHPGHDGSAEWNFFNHPIAADKVLKSGIPITLVCLDITNELPVTPQFVNRLKNLRNFSLARFAYEAWQIVLKNPDQEYYMWDILTVAALLAPNLFDFREEKISIVTTPPSEGRSKPDPKGISVRIPTLKNRKDDVEDFFLTFFQR